MLFLFIVVSIELFVIGFLFGLFRVKYNIHWLVRAILGGLLFAFFYIAIPLAHIYEYIYNGDN